MSLAVGMAVLLLLLATGWWPSAVLGARTVCPGRVGRCSLALTLGAAITGLVQITLSLAGLATGMSTCVVLAALSLLALRLAPARSARAAADPAAELTAAADPAGGLGAALAVWLLAVVIVSSIVSVGLPFSGDGSKFWAPKARDLAHHPALSAPSLSDETQLGFHRGYPLLVPALMAPAFGLSPADASAGAKLVLHGLGLALLGLIASLLSATGAHGRWVAAAVLAMPMMMVPAVRESLGAGGYVDGVCALFLLLVVDVVDRLRRGAALSGDALLAVLVGAALVSTKLEGSVELAIVLIAWLLAGPTRGRSTLLLLAGVAVLVIPTLWLRSALPSDPAITNPALLWQSDVLLARAVPVLAGLGGLLIDTSALGLGPLTVLGCALSRRPRWGFGTLLLLGSLAFLVLVYMSTTMHVGRHMHTSLHRLALHWLPAFALLACRGAARGR